MPQKPIMIQNQKLQIVVNHPKIVPDDIEKDVTDVTGLKEVMGGSEHSQNEFTHENNDMNAIDQSKQGLETEIGTDNPNGPESEGTDEGNVGTDVISPLERVLLMTKVMNLRYYHLILHQMGRSLRIKNIWNKKKEEEKKKRKEKNKQRKKEKNNK